MESPTEETPTNNLVYEDDNHQNTLLQSLIRLQKSGQFCDAKLVVGAHEIPIHKAVLASSSGYLFDQFLKGEENPKPQEVYKLKDIDYSSFQYLINFAYTGRLEVPAGDVIEVYSSSLQLRMSGATSACSKYLAANLSPTSCLGIRAIASDAKLIAAVNQYISDHVGDVANSTKFYGIPRIPVEIIGADDDILTSESHTQLFELVLVWAKNNIEYNDHWLEDLTEQVNVLYLNADNTLMDCRDDIKDENINDDDAVQDYKKLSKKKPPCSKTKETNGSMSPSMSHFRKFTITPESPAVEKEWGMIASYRTNEHTLMGVAMLNGTVATISLHYRPQPQSSHSSSEDPDSPVYTNKSMPRFLERHRSLIPLATMSTPRCGFGLCLLGGKLFACGGYDRGECLKSVEQYVLKLNTWTTLTDMDLPRVRFSAAEIDGKIYACGGSNGHHDLQKVECYSLEEGCWKFVAATPQAKASPGIASLNGLIYSIGGCVGQIGVTDCHVYNPETDEWSSIASLNTGRYQASVCRFQGHLYAIGGTDSWNCISTVEVYDPVSNAWQFDEQLNVARRGAGVAVLNGKLYVVGGNDGSQALRSTEIYDPKVGAWVVGPIMSTPRANVGVATCENRLYAVGGFNGKKFLDTMEYLDVEMNEWSSYMPAEDVPVKGKKAQKREAVPNSSNEASNLVCQTQNGVHEIERT